ncbi:GNAT family N-acetyltransferase [Pseudonocardia sp. HH130630-07]|uniref:GNAT family N-acetyltransferase n=1 Tax=Pseudonocardia sp. HH130630-07 TaxID=1690815 RepID=UPI000814D971|nr:GNAT family N-acetyltransferase [Pseudonocardia sp. HH130630-07]ANY07943.1 hypothetical protein AFB00_18385 [Pseudonocardia sp. HH130630-07]
MTARVLRRATTGDVADLVRLRAEMFRAMGSPDHDAPGWRAAAARWFTDRLDDPRVRIVVVEVGGRVVATAMGAVRDSAPAPSAPGGGDVLISNVCTDPGFRRRGHARAAFTAVVEWSATTGAGRAELMATAEGHSLYDAAGFRTVTFPAMRAPLPPGGA